MSQRHDLRRFTNANSKNVGRQNYLQSKFYQTSNTKKLIETLSDISDENNLHERKILFFGLFAGVNLILLDDVSEPILIPSSAQSSMKI